MKEVINTTVDVLDTITEYSVSNISSPSVYFLFNEYNEVIYIGSSVAPFSRVTQHSHDSIIPFITFKIISLNKSGDACLATLEARNILKYKPKFNKMLPYNRFWMGLGTVRRLKGLTVKQYPDLIAEVKTKNIKEIFYLKYPIYDVNDLYKHGIITKDEVDRGFLDNK